MTKFKNIIICLMILLTVVFASGCTISAYDIAVKNGFNGTEQEWLDSLQGTDGTNVNIKDIYDEAYKNGYEGTYLEFIKEYLTFEEGQDNSAAISIAMKSAVIVYCEFNSSGYFGSQNKYAQAGSGIIYKIDKNSKIAYIITNYHVVYGSKNGEISNNIKLYPYGNYEISATYIGGTPQYDIAVLKAENDYFTNGFAQPAIVANVNDISIGQTAIAIGNPEGHGLSVTQGIISVESEYIKMSDIVNSFQEVEMRVIRVDAAVNSGNSGGGLFDAHGQLIGIVNAKSADSSNENLSYAIPVSIACGVADNIIKNGKFAKGTLGISLLGENVKAYLDENGLVKLSETVLVKSVDGASKGKLEIDDIIKSVTVNDKTVEVKRTYHVVDAVLSASPGETVTLVIIRNGTEKEVSITCA